MPSTTSYPRTSFRPGLNTFPSGALSNIRDPALRSRLQKLFDAPERDLRQAKGDGLILSTPQRAVLDNWIEAYIKDADPADAALIKADVERLLESPEIGAIPGKLPLRDKALVDTSEVERTLIEIRSEDAAQNTHWAAAVVESFAPGRLTRPSFHDDTCLFRCIGGTTGIGEHGSVVYSTNDENGCFWGVVDSKGEVPKTEAQWRSEYAIQNVFNADGLVVVTRFGDLDKTTQEQILNHGIVGRAGPQPSAARNAEYYLPGGGRQLYVPPHVKISNGVRQNIPKIIRSAWNTNGQ